MLAPLSGMDAGFLYMETPSLHMHTLKVAIVDVPDFPDGIPFTLFKKILEKRLRRLPGFRQRVVEIPFGLGHPVWTQDPDFDLSHHVKFRRLAAPGGTRELETAVSEIAGTGLPRNRPLWEITMIDGLAEGRLAFVCKIHHSMGDGLAVLEMLLRVFRDPTPGEPPPAEPLPGRTALLRYAGRSALRRIFDLPSLVMQTIQGLVAWIERAFESPQQGVPLPFAGPSLPFNAALTPERSFRIMSLPLDDLKRVRKQLGVTLNDVILAVCAGALRIDLARAGVNPARSLIAGVPVNTQPGEQGRLSGNHVGHLMTSLFTDVDDPVARIAAIHAATQEAKDRHAARGLDIMERWFEYAPPKPFASVVRFWSKHHLADRLPPPINLIVSNVRGPREPLSIAGAHLEALYSVGPILEGIGLNLTGWSYAGRMNIVALACPQHMPQLERLCAELPVALAELMDACDLRQAGEEPSRDAVARKPSSPTGVAEIKAQTGVPLPSR